VQRLADVQRRLGDDPGLSVVSFSVDPAADTPDVLHAYGQSRAIDPSRWKLLTGGVGEMIELIRKGFMLAVARAADVAPEELTSSGPIIHSVHLVLVDPAMQVRGYYDSTDPEAMKRLIADTQRLLREAGA
jgi:protein SCO1/2